MSLTKSEDGVEIKLTDEELINYRLCEITKKIKDDENKLKKIRMDPYFDSIKNWNPF